MGAALLVLASMVLLALTAVQLPRAFHIAWQPRHRSSPRLLRCRMHAESQQASTKTDKKQSEAKNVADIRAEGLSKVNEDAAKNVEEDELIDALAKEDEDEYKGSRELAVRGTEWQRMLLKYDKNDLDNPHDPRNDIPIPAANWTEYTSQNSLTGFAMAALSAIGAADTGYLTAAKYHWVGLACPFDFSSCAQALNSHWSMVDLGLLGFGNTPLSQIGFFAYMLAFGLSMYKAMGPRDVKQGEPLSDIVLWWLAFIMASVSFGLGFILLFDLTVRCSFCLVSAVCSGLILALAETNQQPGDPELIQQNKFPLSVFKGTQKGAITPNMMTTDAEIAECMGYHKEVEEAIRVRMSAMGSYWLTRKHVLGLPYLVLVFSGFDAYWLGGKSAEWETVIQRFKPEPPPLRNQSNRLQVALAMYLSKIGARCYTAWWCPRCQEQRELFGIKAAGDFFIQCEDKDRKPREFCPKDIDGVYPVWEINGKRLPAGSYDLLDLAKYSGFEPLQLGAKLMTMEEMYPRQLGKEGLEYIWGERVANPEKPQQ